jgi:hypothetical protein
VGGQADFDVQFRDPLERLFVLFSVRGRPPGGAAKASSRVEEQVSDEDGALVRQVEAQAAGRMAGGVKDFEFAQDREKLAVDEMIVHREFPKGETSPWPAASPRSRAKQLGVGCVTEDSGSRQIPNLGGPTRVIDVEVGQEHLPQLRGRSSGILQGSGDAPAAPWQAGVYEGRTGWVVQEEDVGPAGPLQ